MDPTEQQLFGQAMAGYERSRLMRSLGAGLPTLLFPLVAFIVGGRLVTSVLLGAGLLAAVVILAWRGMAWGMSVPAGLKAGAFPLTLALISQRIGHVCTAEGCTSLCVPMCSAGGVIAGLVVVAAARRSPAPLLTLAGGLVLSVAVGAMGCSCVGLSGVLGMLAGLALSIALSAAARWAR